ncbi:MAG: hypothetical protein WCV88_00835 [Patescibacteria group bacterium]
MKEKLFLTTAAVFALTLTGCAGPSTNVNTVAVTNEIVNVNPVNTNAEVNTNENINVTVVNENTNLTNENTNTEIVSEVDTSDWEQVTVDEGVLDTSDWLTYTNEEYGFSFKYPKIYSVSVSKSTRADFIDDAGAVFMIDRTDLQIDPVRITLFDSIVAHPTTSEINSVQSVLGPRPDGSYDNVVNETTYSVQQYYGENFRVQGLTGNYPVDEDHKLQDVAEYYYLDSDEKTLEIRLTDEAATGIDPDTLLNSLQF